MSAVLEAWFEALPEQWKDPAQRIRELLLEASPVMKEEWKYGTPFYSHRRWMCYLSLQRTGLVLGFVQGRNMLDPDGLFAPTDHAQIQHFLPKPAPAPLPEAALRRLIAEAIGLNEEILREKLLKKAGRKR
jgi:hypothetical protein